MKSIKRIVSVVIDWFLYTLLKPRHKEALSKLLTQKQKETIKKIIRPGKKQAQVRKIERVKFKLYELGFYEKGIEELTEYYRQNENKLLKKLAGMELALWYANKYDEEMAKESLSILNELKTLTKDKKEQQRIAIMKAESLQKLGQTNKAKQLLVPFLKENNDDIYLAYANLEEDNEAKLKWINKIFEKHNEIKIELQDNKSTTYDSLYPVGSYEKVKNKYKVSIIVPVYNAGRMIDTAIRSLLNQSWENIEVIIVDDCSTDDTYTNAKEYETIDSRVKVIKTKQNGGAYTARNTALQYVTGDFITINDADDWSHPKKIETQALELINNDQLMGNFSNQARATEELTFYRRGKFGQFIFPNMSSFMFRKEVLEKLGYWDQVRFGADAEFVKRVKIIYGEKSVKQMNTAPLSFQRQSSDSLTGNSAFGFPGYFMGARREYRDAHENYHQNNRDQLKYSFPVEKRPFPVPEPMWPTREEKMDGRRHFDVIIVSEFRLLGGTNMSNIEEIKAQKALGMKTGLIQLSRYDLNSLREMNPKVREQIDGENVSLIVYGEKVSCDVLIIRHPPILEEWQKYVPDIRAKKIAVIVNQTPKRDYSETGETLYDIKTSVKRLEQYFDNTGTWFPIGPIMRQALVEHHEEDLKHIHLSDKDWINIIHIEEWKRENRPKNKNIVIGRHSRDHEVKWPTTKDELLRVYPNYSPYEVRVLGGAKAPIKLLNGIPNNWKVFEFGEMEPKQFLKDLDVFVYYTHPDLKEAFGRVIFEAMAVGVPVILPPVFKPVFEEAAIYAETNEVLQTINWLIDHKKAYDRQVNIAFEYVEKHFGYSQHEERLRSAF